MEIRTVAVAVIVAALKVFVFKESNLEYGAKKGLRGEVATLTEK